MPGSARATHKVPDFGSTARPESSDPAPFPPPPAVRARPLRPCRGRGGAGCHSCRPAGAPAGRGGHVRPAGGALASVFTLRFPPIPCAARQRRGSRHSGARRAPIGGRRAPPRPTAPRPPTAVVPIGARRPPRPLRARGTPGKRAASATQRAWGRGRRPPRRTRGPRPPPAGASSRRAANAEFKRAPGRGGEEGEKHTGAQRPGRPGRGPAPGSGNRPARSDSVAAAGGGEGRGRWADGRTTISHTSWFSPRQRKPRKTPPPAPPQLPPRRRP